jgi:hypothetical protein
VKPGAKNESVKPKQRLYRTLSKDFCFDLEQVLSLILHEKLLNKPWHGLGDGSGVSLPCRISPRASCAAPISLGA